MICILVNDIDFETAVSPVERALEMLDVKFRTWKTFLKGFPEDKFCCDGLILTGGFSMSEYFEGVAPLWGAAYVKRFPGPVLGICRLRGETQLLSRESPLRTEQDLVFSFTLRKPHLAQRRS
ncbi:MAG: GMP synthase family protein [Mesotoga infera]|uniref:GMP synthase family protein n=1 Tax=Mesotoga infera TaxID=1236046 RepID=A0A101I8Z6_9BACT|nr:MAG: GMP synthase family protein [Mesotoga infera]